MEVITVTFLNEVTTVDVHTNDVLTLREFDCFERIQKLDRDYSNWQILVVYHWQKVSGRSGWKVNGTRLFGSFWRKIQGSNRSSEKVALFFQVGMFQTEIRVPFVFFKAIFI